MNFNQSGICNHLHFVLKPPKADSYTHKLLSCMIERHLKDTFGMVSSVLCVWDFLRLKTIDDINDADAAEVVTFVMHTFQTTGCLPSSLLLIPPLVTLLRIVGVEKTLKILNHQFTKLFLRSLNMHLYDTSLLEWGKKV